jgi:hypothetical protein
MNPFQFNTPILTVTNPVLLWLFRHGWEDPGWGRTPVGQIAIASTVYELANQLGDAAVRKQIQAGAAKAMAITAERMAAEQ